MTNKLDAFDKVGIVMVIVMCLIMALGAVFAVWVGIQLIEILREGV